MNPQLQSLLRTGQYPHVLYSYSSESHYIEMAVSYILDGIASNEHVFLIDNERLYPLIAQQVRSQVSREQFELLCFVKNFDFYYSSGSYHPPAILAYFNDLLKRKSMHDKPFRSWAHVEWGSMKEPVEVVRELEQHIDWAVNSLSFPLICAYRLDRMPAHLMTILEETHPYILTDETFLSSAAYQSQVPADLKL
ncbi:hypothetical protein NCCP2716_28140 [Sporosarcina sp. NCCP-2716]|uniref:MEDS domain-containing protein n=1 Tax=Sporosarcina sp. NCCP-2716 TaxID=2943679 RepID=UPI00203CA067|nr:MEDS domain-containing protein [Sporosarcina sp. NCCP-2716]GKV70316.1 hypothetical protein NCCP2716_28140 [Sporosarcina sp. NCCP-2716]